LTTFLREAGAPLDNNLCERALKRAVLRFHQVHSGPMMEKLHGWLEGQFAGRKTEPNSGLGKAITYLLRHWKGTGRMRCSTGRCTEPRWATCL
jgi:hypothetical protein